MEDEHVRNSNVDDVMLVVLVLVPVLMLILDKDRADATADDVDCRSAIEMSNSNRISAEHH